MHQPGFAFISGINRTTVWKFSLKAVYLQFIGGHFYRFSNHLEIPKLWSKNFIDGQGRGGAILIVLLFWPIVKNMSFPIFTLSLEFVKFDGKLKINHILAKFATELICLLDSRELNHYHNSKSY